MLIIVMSTILIFYSSICFAGDLNKLDDAGYKILNIVRKVGFWIILIQSTREVLGCAMSGATKSIGGIITKYVIMYGALFALPWLLRLVEGIF